MKKIKLIIIFLFFSINIFCEKISIVSWNINTKDSEKIINTITNLVKNEKVDIILLQEVKLDLQTIPNSINKKIKSGGFLDRLKKALTTKTLKEWDFYSSANYSIRANYMDYRYCSKGQDNAIFFCSDKFIGNDLYKKFGLNNFATCKFKTDKNNFQIINLKMKTQPNIDLYLGNIHLPFIHDEGRINDLQTILKLFSKELSGNKKILIGGDFNTHSVELSDRIRGFDFKIGIKSETTLSKNKYRLASQYDHFLFNSYTGRHLVSPPIPLGKVREDKLVLGYYGLIQEFNYNEYRSEISDHIPILIRLYF